MDEVQPLTAASGAAKTTKAMDWLRQELSAVPEDAEAMEVEEIKSASEEAPVRSVVTLTPASGRLTLENVTRVSATAEERGPRQLVAPTL